MNREDLRVDQGFIVWTGVGTRNRYDGRVAKIARKYVTIEFWRGPHWTSELEFDIETQKERGNTGHYAATFISYEDQERKDREKRVREGLKSWGISVSYGGPTSKRRVTLEQMEGLLGLLEWSEGNDEDPEVPGGAPGTPLPGV